MNLNVKTFALALLIILLFTLAGAACPYAATYLLVSSSGLDLGGPFSGSREVWADFIGDCLVIPGTVLGFSVGLVVALMWWGNRKLKPTAKEDEEK